MSVIAPGLDRSLKFEGDEDQKESSSIKKDNAIFNIEDMMAPIDGTFDFLNVKTNYEASKEEAAVESETKGNKFFFSFYSDIDVNSILFIIDSQEVDEFLPTTLPPQKDLATKKPALANEALKRREWAHEINVNEPFDNFYDLVPEMALQVNI